jgi:hypothetical protein
LDDGSYEHQAILRLVLTMAIGLNPIALQDLRLNGSNKLRDYANGVLATIKPDNRIFNCPT